MKIIEKYREQFPFDERTDAQIIKEGCIRGYLSNYKCKGENIENCEKCWNMEINIKKMRVGLKI